MKRKQSNMTLIKGRKRTVGRPPEGTEGDWTQAFLLELAQRGNVTDACRAAGVSRNTAYQKRMLDEVFAECWDFARAAAGDALEREAWRRAVEGVASAKTVAGEREEYREYSDALLIVLLKGAKPEKYKENAPIYRLSDAEVESWSLEQCQAHQDGMPVPYVRMLGKIQQRQLALPPPPTEA